MRQKKCNSLQTSHKSHMIDTSMTARLVPKRIKRCSNCSISQLLMVVSYVQSRSKEESTKRVLRKPVKSPEIIVVSPESPSYAARSFIDISFPRDIQVTRGLGRHDNKVRVTLTLLGFRAT